MELMETLRMEMRLPLWQALLTTCGPTAAFLASLLWAWWRAESVLGDTARNLLLKLGLCNHPVRLYGGIVLRIGRLGVQPFLGFGGRTIRRYPNAEDASSWQDVTDSFTRSERKAIYKRAAERVWLEKKRLATVLCRELHDDVMQA